MAKQNERMRQLVAELESKRAEALKMGGERRVARQHERGKLDARQRVDYLFDDGSFTEFGIHAFFHANGKPVPLDEMQTPADGVITGWGKINGRTVVVAAYDFTVLGGSIGEVSERKVTRCREFALKHRVPIVWLIDSAGVYAISNFALSGYLFREQVTLSGVVPQIAAMVGPGAAGTAYIPGLADFVPMVDGTSSMALGGPPLVKAAVGEDIDEETLGGAKVHNAESGVADQIYGSDEECLDAIKAYLAYFPSNCEEKPPEAPFVDDPSRDDEGGKYREKLLDVLPESSRRAYDMHKLIKYVVDEDSVFEIKPLFAPNIVTCFARIGGRSVGVVANNPLHKGGILDIDSADKAARFINLCDSFNIPLVFFQDVPGFIIGSRVEKAGIIRHGAKMLYEVAKATVPKVTVLVRKCYGAGYYVMCGRAYEPDLIVAWPTAEISVMGPEGMVNIFARRMLENNPNAEELKQQMVDGIRPFIDIYKVAGKGYIDEVIDPRQTRDYIRAGLELAENKQVERPWRKDGVRPV